MSEGMPATAERLTDPRDRHIEATPDTLYLLWSLKHGAWWASNDCGYTSHIRHAGRYRTIDACWRVTRAALSGDWRKGTVMVAAPEMWGLDDYPRDDLPAPCRYCGRLGHGFACQESLKASGDWFGEGRAL